MSSSDNDATAPPGYGDGGIVEPLIPHEVSIRIESDSPMSSRPVLQTSDPSSIRVVHRAKMSRSMKWSLLFYTFMCPCSAAYCWREPYLTATYAQVHENRVEFNQTFLVYPSMTFIKALSALAGLIPFGRKLLSLIVSLPVGLPGSPCCCLASDSVSVRYFDEGARHSARAGFCYPLCTHCSPCPTCFDACGEGVVVWHQNRFFPWMRSWELVPGLQNADEFLMHIEQARSTRLAQAKEAILARKKSSSKLNATSPSPKPLKMTND